MAGKLDGPVSKPKAPETGPVTKPPSKSEYLMMESLVETADDEFSLSTNPEVTQMELVRRTTFHIFPLTLMECFSTQNTEQSSPDWLPWLAAATWSWTRLLWRETNQSILFIKSKAQHLHRTKWWSPATLHWVVPYQSRWKLSLNQYYRINITFAMIYMAFDLSTSFVYKLVIYLDR